MTVAELAWRKPYTTERNAVTVLLRQHPHYALLLATNLPAKATDTNEWIFLRAATWPDMVRPSRDAAHPKPKCITGLHLADWHNTNTADTITHRPAAFAGLRMGKKLKALF